MAFIGIFDVIGPNMIGPSSSHTAGAVTISLLARKMIQGRIVRASFVLYGSFAETGKGHGTDKALVAGALGMLPSDLRIRDSFAIAERQGISVTLRYDTTVRTLHPNTVDIELESESHEVLRVRGESLGGGKVHIINIDGVDVDFSGEYCAIMVVHKDEPGVISYITTCLSELHINIAYMKLFRETRGSLAYTFVESDDQIPESCVRKIKHNTLVQQALLIQNMQGDRECPDSL